VNFTSLELIGPNPILGYSRASEQEEQVSGSGCTSVRNKAWSGWVRPLQKYEEPMQSCNMWGPRVGPTKPPSVCLYMIQQFISMKTEHHYNFCKQN